MKLRDFHLKLKALRLKRLLLWRFNGRRRRRMKKKPSILMYPLVSHGCHAINRLIIRKYFCDDEYECDSVVVQREQIENTELWYFGIFDALIGDGVVKYLQCHLFQKLVAESRISSRICRKTLKRAYSSLTENMRLEDDTSHGVGFASVLVIDGEKLVTAQIGDWKAVVCRDGIAYHTESIISPHWTRNLFPGGRQSSESSELVIRAQRIHSDTEFIILASNGIWDVMKNQEAVDLTWHIQNPNEAAKCLANEALNRFSKRNISCIIIRFD